MRADDDDVHPDYVWAGPKSTPVPRSTVTGSVEASLASVVVTRQDGDVSATYVGGNLALDFVGTLSERNRTRLEHLHSTADLAAWLRGAGVLDDLPAGDGQELGRALQLREALFAVIEALIDRKTLPAGEELVVINAAAAVPPPQPASRPTDAFSGPATSRPGSPRSPGTESSCSTKPTPGSSGAPIRTARIRSWTSRGVTDVAGAAWPDVATGPRRPRTGRVAGPSAPPRTTRPPDLEN